MSCSIYVSRSLNQFQVHGRAPRRTGVYDQMEQLFTNRKFHFFSHQNFRVFFLNGKHPSFRKYINLNFRVFTVCDTKIGMLTHRKKSLSSWFSAVKPFLLIEDEFMCTYASSRVKRKSFYRKNELQMVLLISGGHICVPKLYTNMASPYKALQKVRETFRQITQKLWAMKTWDLDKLFIF